MHWFQCKGWSMDIKQGASKRVQALVASYNITDGHSPWYSKRRKISPSCWGGRGRPSLRSQSLKLQFNQLIDWLNDWLNSITFRWYRWGFLQGYKFLLEWRLLAFDFSYSLLNNRNAIKINMLTFNSSKNQ